MVDTVLIVKRKKQIACHNLMTKGCWFSETQCKKRRSYLEVSKIKMKKRTNWRTSPSAIPWGDLIMLCNCHGRSTLAGTLPS
jgi:hypothetical protein